MAVYASEDPQRLDARPLLELRAVPLSPLDKVASELFIASEQKISPPSLTEAPPPFPVIMGPSFVMLLLGV